MHFRSSFTKCTLLAAVAITTYVPTALVAYGIGGPPGVLAATAAAGLCLLGVIVPLAMPARMIGAAPVYEVILGMLVRMGIPLGGGLALHLSATALASAGVLYYLLVFYPVLLATHTWLCLRADQAQRFARKLDKPTKPLRPA